MFKERNNKNRLVGHALKEIHREREHNELVQEAKILRAYVKEIKERLHIAQPLETCGGEDVRKKMDSTLISDYQIQIFKRSSNS